MIDTRRIEQAAMLVVSIAMIGGFVYYGYKRATRPCTLYEQTEHMVSKSADGPFRLRYTAVCVSWSQP